ncbi:hypothetical protein BKA70DRAFT_883417 [Coprinopsis sp. MPI-PUGE-AT-0042]|nr:hypothetical protein BKA70DRAFT_883417 [Coprinopsis sp. MPI-PUGE-AT-0042]
MHPRLDSSQTLAFPLRQRAIVCHLEPTSQRVVGLDGQDVLHRESPCLRSSVCVQDAVQLQKGERQSQSSNKTKSNSKSLSKSKQIKALCNASPTAKKSTGVNSVLSLGSTNAANTATIRASGGVKAMVARLNEQSSQSQLSSLFNHGSQHQTSKNKRSSTSRFAAALRPEEVEHKSPITKEARRMLGGSLCGSDVSTYQVEVDESDPDSDVPEELRVILRKDDRAVKAYGTGRNARVFEQEEDVYSDEEDSKPHHRDEEEDDFDNDGEGYTIDHDDMTLDLITDEWSVEVPRSAPAVFTQQPVFSASHLGVPPTGSPLGSSIGLSNSVGLSSSMASVATVRQASIQRLPVFRAQLVHDTSHCNHCAFIGPSIDGYLSCSPANERQAPLGFLLVVFL